MAQYIDKSALVAKIEKRREKNSRNKLNLVAAFENNYLLSFLDTLEVKEVDLEKECAKYFEENDLCVHDDYIKFARHFFELGLKTQKGE
jgi:hypothetical protein